jgi:TPP-dependent pyruvate/acetoin dehydrogenase alpha subunit
VLREELIELYEIMVRIRYFELRTKEMVTRGKLRGGAHLYIGEEAIAAGVCSNLTSDDYIVSTHRGHGHCLAKGGDPKLMMAELLGRESGYCKGKGGSMHIADLRIGILAENGIVGGGLPISLGAGFSAKYRNSGQVTVCFFGDGASNQGTFHESLNMAAVWRQPIVYVCENNQYAVSTHVSRSTSVENIYQRASSYGIPGLIVDGNDVEVVYAFARESIRRAREGRGPTLMECKTYRIEGHYVGDPAIYRSKEDVEVWKQRDPVIKCRERILKQWPDEGDNLDQIERSVLKIMEDAEKFATEANVLHADEVTEDVFA